MRVTTALPLTWGVAAAGGRSSSGNGLGMGLGHLSFVGLGRICRLGLSVRLGEELGGAQGAGRQGGVVLVGLSPRLAHDETVLPQQAKHAGWGFRLTVSHLFSELPGRLTSLLVPWLASPAAGARHRRARRSAASPVSPAELSMQIQCRARERVQCRVLLQVVMHLLRIWMHAEASA